VIALIVVGGIILVKSKRAKEAKIPVAKVYPIVVKTIQVQPSEVELTLPYLAQIENEDNVVLASRISARVLYIKKSGDSVKKGEVLARLDTTDLNAEIESTKVSLKNLLKTHNRTLALYRVKGASIEQLQKEESGIASLQGKLKALKNQLSYTTLLSPISGVIAKTYATEGSIAMPGKALIDISAAEGFSLLVRLPDDIKPKSILFREKEYPIRSLGSTFHGLNEYKATIQSSHLSTGETTEIKVLVFKGTASKLPFDAILDRNGKSYILTIQKDHAVPKEIQILQKGEEGIVTRERLETKRIVVAKPDILLKLLTGISVKVEE
jgi:hypothetical protein